MVRLGDVKLCSLCGQPFHGMGNNPEPLARFEERCCDCCNAARVIPARLAQWVKRPIQDSDPKSDT